MVFSPISQNTTPKEIFREQCSQTEDPYIGSERETSKFRGVEPNGCTIHSVICCGRQYCSLMHVQGFRCPVIIGCLLEKTLLMSVITEVIVSSKNNSFKARFELYSNRLAFNFYTSFFLKEESHCLACEEVVSSPLPAAAVEVCWLVGLSEHKSLDVSWHRIKSINFCTIWIVGKSQESFLNSFNIMRTSVC